MTKAFDQTVEKFKEFSEVFGNDTSTSWYEGYASALANHELITEDEFDRLMSMVGKHTNEAFQTVIDLTCANMSTKQ